MPQLHSFNFYICTYKNKTDLAYYISCEDIQRIFTNIKQQHVASVVNGINHINHKKMICHIFTVPFLFDRLEDIDVVPFYHGFFIRIARAFPLLKNFRILNFKSQSSRNSDVFI
ncbi:unnamed protein product [Adineta steineri]|uniref:Uncharacterized protein n=1 Tax=Adineta steineri TaxID=433720 RepID=A0A816E0W9_9BILA|nr:unnamed protein product [Adineta steineri]CAF1641622.1 unnamed protein product [Adineta steineri]